MQSAGQQKQRLEAFMKAARAEDQKPRTPGVALNVYRGAGARGKSGFRRKKFRTSRAPDAGILDVWKHVDAGEDEEESESVKPT